MQSPWLSQWHPTVSKGFGTRVVSRCYEVLMQKQAFKVYMKASFSLVKVTNLSSSQATDSGAQNLIQGTYFNLKLTFHSMNHLMVTEFQHLPLPNKSVMPILSSHQVLRSSFPPNPLGPIHVHNVHGRWGRCKPVPCQQLVSFFQLLIFF